MVDIFSQFQLDFKSWFKKESLNIMEETAAIVKDQNKLLYDMLKKKIANEAGGIHDRLDDIDEKLMILTKNGVDKMVDEKINEMKKKMDEMNGEKKKMDEMNSEKEKMNDEKKNKELTKRASTSTPKVCVLLDYSV